MKSSIICIRLRPNELSWLDKYCQGEGYSGRSEYLRALLHREHAKRSRTKQTLSESQWKGDVRIGRPRQ